MPRLRPAGGAKGEAACEIIIIIKGNAKQELVLAWFSAERVSAMEADVQDTTRQRVGAGHSEDGPPQPTRGEAHEERLPQGLGGQVERMKKKKKEKEIRNKENDAPCIYVCIFRGGREPLRAPLPPPPPLVLDLESLLSVLLVFFLSFPPQE